MKRKSNLLYLSSNEKNVEKKLNYTLIKYLEEKFNSKTQDRSNWSNMGF